MAQSVAHRLSFGVGLVGGKTGGWSRVRLFHEQKVQLLMEQTPCPGLTRAGCVFWQM